MSEEIDKKLYAHYKSLAGGSKKSSNPIRDELIKSDAAKHLADLIKKTRKVKPDFVFEEEIKPDKPKEKKKNG